MRSAGHPTRRRLASARDLRREGLRASRASCEQRAFELCRELRIPRLVRWMRRCLDVFFEFMPTEGDCINTPVTGYRQFTQVFLTTS